MKTICLLVAESNPSIDSKKLNGFVYEIVLFSYSPVPITGHCAEWTVSLFVSVF
jgi:hypothetical protein